MIDQVVDDLYEDKLEELFQHYEYIHELPSYDMIISGVSIPDIDIMKNTEITSLYEYMIGLIEYSQNKIKESQFLPQKKFIFKNVISLIPMIDNLELKLFSYQILKIDIEEEFSSLEEWENIENQLSKF